MRTLLSLFLLTAALSAQGQYINTLAGTGVATSTGDGGPATAATINRPIGIVADASGNVYVTDFFHRVRKVNSSGVITPFAGTGTGTYNGDGMSATATNVGYPNDITTDIAGNFFIAEKGGYRIRKIDASGIVSTVAGNGTGGYSGDNVPATTTTIYEPTSIAVDAAGNLYISDKGNNRIRKVNTSGIITTIAGNGTAGFGGDNGPATAAMFNGLGGLALDNAGNLYVCDVVNGRVRKIATDGTITTVAGTGSSIPSGADIPATDATLMFPADIAFNAAGELLIASDNYIWKVDVSGFITIVAGNASITFGGDGGPATMASLYGPAGIAIGSTGKMYISDQGHNRVRYTYGGVGVSSAANKRAITLFPNPSANGKFTVDLSLGGKEQVDMYIVDIRGMVVYREKCMGGKPKEIELPHVPGVYLLSATTVNGTYTKQLIIN